VLYLLKECLLYCSLKSLLVRHGSGSYWPRSKITGGLASSLLHSTAVTATSLCDGKIENVEPIDPQSGADEYFAKRIFAQNLVKSVPVFSGQMGEI